MKNYTGKRLFPIKWHFNTECMVKHCDNTYGSHCVCVFFFFFTFDNDIEMAKRITIIRLQILLFFFFFVVHIAISS